MSRGITVTWGGKWRPPFTNQDSPCVSGCGSTTWSGSNRTDYRRRQGRGDPADFLSVPAAPPATHMQARSVLGADAKVKLLYVLVARQGRCVTLQNQAAALEHVTVISDRQRLGRILLDQKNAGTLPVDFADHFEDLCDKQGRQSQARFIKHDQLGPAHDGPGDRQHLLLTA